MTQRSFCPCQMFASLYSTSTETTVIDLYCILLYVYFLVESGHSKHFAKTPAHAICWPPLAWRTKNYSQHPGRPPGMFSPSWSFVSLPQPPSALGVRRQTPTQLLRFLPVFLGISRATPRKANKIISNSKINQQLSTILISYLVVVA